MSNNTTTTKGIGFVGLLQVAFIVLKLCNVITWNWIWVLAPLWIDAILVLLLIIIAVIGTLKGGGRK